MFNYVKEKKPEVLWDFVNETSKNKRNILFENISLLKTLTDEFGKEKVWTLLDDKRKYFEENLLHVTYERSDLDVKSIFDFMKHIKFENTIDFLSQRNYFGDTPLHSVLLFDQDKIELFLTFFKELKADILLKNKNNETPEGERDPRLLKLWSLFEIRNNSGDTIFHLAAINNNVELFKLIIEFTREFKQGSLKKCVNTKNKDNETPFDVALKYCNDKLLEYLLEIKEFIIPKDKYQNLLHVAVSMRNEVIFKFLKEKSESKDIKKYMKSKNRCWKNALISSIRRGSFKFLELLLESGADPNFRNGDSKYTPLFTAICTKNVEMVKTLLNYGADTKILEDGNTPFDVALENYNDKILEYFLEIKEFIIPKDKYQNLLHVAVYQRNEVIFKFIKENSESEDLKNYMKIKNRWGNNALISSIRRGSLKFLELLLESGADPNLRNDNGKYTPLFAAICTKNVEMVKTLLKYGADKTTIVYEKTAFDKAKLRFHYAKENKYETNSLSEIIKLFAPESSS